ncbi:MAG: hypothetical protein IKY94_11555 [Lachnospiraceae bacterium]|nr:hypothetical protein [Lachnospiraceae bacterium]
MLLIEDYLQVFDNYVLSDRTIDRALLSYDIERGTPAFDVSERDRDLAEAMVIESALFSMRGGSYRKQIGDRSISTSDLKISDADRALWMNKVKMLRLKWGVATHDLNVSRIEDYTILW